MALAAGVRLGAYEIVSLIGAGGMGEVYRARDTRLGRTVAIKVLAAAASEDDSARQRLFREARTISSLDHPYICALYDIGRENGIDYLVMQHLEGETLAAVLRQGPLEVETAVRYASEIGDALDAAHSRGIVHRDLKPANVMITASGARLLDFGLAMPRARARGAASSQLTGDDTTRSVITGPGKVLGTLPYMAPEQLEGQPADARSDIFSFGAMFYEMLTGRRPFIATADAGVMTQILGVMPPPPSRVSRAVPAAVDAVVLRCLAKAPADRWQTIRAVLNSLTVALNASQQTRLMAPWRYAAGAAAVLAIVVAAGLPYLNRGTPGEPVATSPAAATTVLAVLPFEVESADPSERAYWEGLAQAVGAKLAALPATHRIYVVPGADVIRRDVRTPRDSRIELGATRAVRVRSTLNTDGIHASLELVDTATLETLRRSTAKAPDRDPAALQNAVVQAILVVLEVTVTGRDRARLLAPQTAPGAYDLYLQGLGYLESYFRPENVDAAIALFERALTLDQKHAPAHAGLGRAYWHKYEQTNDALFVESARRACERALGLDEGDPTPHACLGTVKTGLGEYEDALEEFRHALEIDSDSEDAYLGLATAYQKMGDTAKAEDTYKRAIALRPGYSAGYSRLGVFYYSSGRYADAEAMFRQVTTLSPDGWRGYGNLGGLYYVQGKIAEAIEAFNTSLAIKLNDQAASNLGTLYFFETGEYLKAAGAFRRAIQISNADHVLWGNLGAALHWAKDEPAARIAFRKAIDLAEARRAVNPRDAHVLIKLGDYYAAVGDRRRAEDLLREGLTLAQDSPSLMHEAAVTYEYRLHDRDNALAWLERALRHGQPWRALERSPGLAALRGDKRFEQLRRHLRDASNAGTQGG